MKYVIETIYDSNPAIKLFIKKMGGSGGQNSAIIPYTQAELEEEMEAVCASYGVEMFYCGVANSYSKTVTTTDYPYGIFPDGVHPNVAMMAQMAKDMTGRITFK